MSETIRDLRGPEVIDSFEQQGRTGAFVGIRSDITSPYAGGVG
jgi:hypothetical protein